MIKQTTGAIESIQDNRTINYSSLPQGVAPIALPAEYETDISMLPVTNQGGIGACVAYVIFLMLQYQNYKETGKVIPLSKRFIYTIARAISGMKGQVGQGLMPLFGFKAIKIGDWDRDVLDDTSLPHADYENMTISEAMKAEAYAYRIGGYAQITDMVTLQKAIMRDGLVAVSLPFGGGNFNQALLSPFTIMDSRHYVTIKGWKTSNGRTKFLFRNSWSEFWGTVGEGAFFWDEYQGQAIDMFSITDVPNSFLESARSTAFQFTSDIAKGASGPIVIELQKALADLGYYTGPVTGYYGNLTAQGVTDFQMRTGIKTNYGKNVGPQTRAKLNELLALLKKNSTNLVTSEKGKALIKNFEGLHDGNRQTTILEPQQDPVGLYTLGWGARYDSKWQDVTSKTAPITMDEANALLDRDLKRFEAVINKENLSLKQEQYDALVSFCYNLGSIFDFGSKIKAGTLSRSDFTKYVNAKGKFLQGLLDRRNREADLYFVDKTGSGNGYNLV